jgi:hypothetical protein
LREGKNLGVLRVLGELGEKSSLKSRVIESSRSVLTKHTKNTKFTIGCYLRFDAPPILLGKGSGGFIERSDSPIATGSDPVSDAWVDFNLYSKPNLAATNASPNNNMPVPLG